MPPNLSSPELKFALGAVRRAAELAKRIQSEMKLEGMQKADFSPVTVADFAIQAAAAKALHEAFPGETLVGEEQSSALRTPDGLEMLQAVTGYVREIIPGAEPDDICHWIDLGQGNPGDRFWTLDPIDGTKGYLRGGQYCIALALLEEGRVTMGVLGCPNLGAGCTLEPGGAGALVVAARGGGAWTSALLEEEEFAPIGVSSTSEARDARILCSYEAAHTNTGQLAELAGTLGATADRVPLDSQAKYALLAAGRGDLLFRLLSPKSPNYVEKIWDHAAGAIVLEEAGGRITDLGGHPLDFTQGRTLAKNRGVCASNGALHDAALEAIQALR